MNGLELDTDYRSDWPTFVIIGTSATGTSVSSQYFRFQNGSSLIAIIDEFGYRLQQVLLIIDFLSVYLAVADERQPDDYDRNDTVSLRNSIGSESVSAESIRDNCSDLGYGPAWCLIPGIPLTDLHKSRSHIDGGRRRRRCCTVRSDRQRSLIVL